MLIPIIYEDDEIFIINKPTGLAVQGGEKIKHSLDKDFSEQVGYKIYLVHRLDKDTCGLMIVAKNPVSANKWTKLISSKTVEKEYIAICCGKISPKKGVISEDILQHGQTRRAVTDYMVTDEWTVTAEKNAENMPGVGGNYEQESGVEGNNEQESGAGGNYEQEAEQKTFTFSKIQLKLHTGRMHQIRIHLAKNNCPICGDDQHGNFKLNKKLWKIFRIKHLLLCSYKLTLPLQGKEQTFEIDLPEEMKGRVGCKE